MKVTITKLYDKTLGSVLIHLIYIYVRTYQLMSPYV
jgi:hypothetical protein